MRPTSPWIPGSPVDRLATILNDSKAPLLIHDGSRTLPVASVRLPELLDEPPGPATGHGSTGDLAYVIYTSGSTGAPKGAMVEQAGMLNHLFAKVADFELGPDNVVVQNAPVCFDISVWQYLAPLLVGGQVWVADDEQAREPRLLWQAVGEGGITILEVVPSLLRAALTDPELVALPALRWLVVTGEALPPDLIRDWLTRHPGVPIVNAYGPPSARTT